MDFKQGRGFTSQGLGTPTTQILRTFTTGFILFYQSLHVSTAARNFCHLQRKEVNTPQNAAIFKRRLQHGWYKES